MRRALGDCDAIRLGERVNFAIFGCFGVYAICARFFLPRNCAYLRDLGWFWLERFKEYCSHSERSFCVLALLLLAQRSPQIYPLVSPRQNPKILAHNGYTIY
jgi:hypothetical protein